MAQRVIFAARTWRLRVKLAVRCVVKSKAQQTAAILDPEFDAIAILEPLLLRRNRLSVEAQALGFGLGTGGVAQNLNRGPLRRGRKQRPASAEPAAALNFKTKQGRPLAHDFVAAQNTDNACRASSDGKGRSRSNWDLPVLQAQQPKPRADILALDPSGR
jgi:hypothetical protein